MLSFCPLLIPKIVLKSVKHNAFSRLFCRFISSSISKLQNLAKILFLIRSGTTKSVKYIVIISICSQSRLSLKNRPKAVPGPFLIPKRLLKCYQKWSKREQRAVCFVSSFLLHVCYSFWLHFEPQILPWEAQKKWLGVGRRPPLDPEQILVYAVFAPL